MAQVCDQAVEGPPKVVWATLETVGVTHFIFGPMSYLGTFLALISLKFTIMLVIGVANASVTVQLLTILYFE